MRARVVREERAVARPVRRADGRVRRGGRWARGMWSRSGAKGAVVVGFLLFGVGLVFLVGVELVEEGGEWGRAGFWLCRGGGFVEGAVVTTGVKKRQGV
jgi:hypothetical protein